MTAIKRPLCPASVSAEPSHFHTLGSSRHECIQRAHEPSSQHLCMCGHRWTGGPDLPEVRVVRVRPGDVLVLAYADPITPDDARRASELLKAEFPGHRAVITSRAELLVVRPDEADLIEEGKAP